MGLGIYEQSLLLFTNASEDVITKSEAREVVLHYKTYSVRQNKRNSRKLTSIQRTPPNNGHWTFVPSCPLYGGSTVSLSEFSFCHFRFIIVLLSINFN